MQVETTLSPAGSLPEWQRRQFSISGIETSALECARTPGGFRISLPRGWLDKHPLTEAALEAEPAEWRPLGIRVSVRALARVAPQRLAA